MVKCGSYHRTIAFKLHVTCGLALVAVLALATASVHFASRTRAATAVLMADGIRGSGIAARLELLVQQHRALVEGAPAQLDRERLIEARRVLQGINGRLSAEIDASSVLQDAENLPIKTLAGQLGRELPDLLTAGGRVLDLAYNFVQDEAVEMLQGPYVSAADRTQRRIHDWRDQRAAILNEQVALLSASADTLISRVLGCAAAVLLLGLLAATTTRRVLSRLEGIKLAMLRLADHDTTVQLPSLSQPDEIGAVARAVQSFKENAIRIGAQDAELKR